MKIWAPIEKGCKNENVRVGFLESVHIALLCDGDWDDM